MKILVAVASRHGATRGIAERIADALERHDLQVTVQPFEQVEFVEAFDGFVVGSSVYMFHWEKDASKFIRDNAALLASRPVWLFGSGPVGTDLVDKEGHDVLESSRPKEFAEFEALIHPRGEEMFFGAYDPNRGGAGLVERLVLTLPAVRDALPAGDFRDWQVIDAWADGIARELVQAPTAAATA
jgi:menaquinone-dependent protoporphyrinogen oxidase